MRFWISSLWGLFLANSWTWCIGLYLPVIMIHRFGWPGFIAFAIPNVLGCAAFGYAVRSRPRSDLMIERHGGAMTWFSIITIAYHIFFITWLVGDLIQLPPDMYWAPPTAAAVMLGLGIVLSYLPSRDWLALSLIVYAVSITALVAIGFAPLRDVPWRGEVPLKQLAWLTPVIVVGFTLCPYLDLTFHRALRESPSRHSFTVFGVAFAVMLILTVAVWFGGMKIALTIVLAHLLAQIGFTMGAHLREIRLSSAIQEPVWRWLAMVGPLLAAAIMPLVHMINAASLSGESVYLRLLVFYALLFPAYVVVCFKWIGRRGVIAFAIVVIALAPLYELGFMHGRMWMATIAAAVLIGIGMLRSNKTPAVHAAGARS